MKKQEEQVPFFDYLRQYEEIRPDIDAAIHRVLTSGRLILDREVEGFESAFARYCGCAHGIGVNSGTDAIQVALRAAGVGPGDEVITVPNTSVATVSAICSAGARPVFADIVPESMLIDPGAIAGRITPRTKAVIPVHLYGRVAEMDAIMEIAGNRGLTVIEDCAQAPGATYGGRKAGSIGHAGCFSFYPTKNLGAYGDAGMVVTNDGTLAGLARTIRTYGWEERDMSLRHGINSRLDELQAAILTAKLPRLDAWNRRRRRIAARYTEKLRGLPVVTPAADDGHAYHLYVIRTRERDALREFLRARGVLTLIHYPVPLHLQPAYADPGHGPGSFPEAERAQREILSLPLWPEMTDGEVETVCSRLATFFAAGR